MALFGRESERDEQRAANYAAWFARQPALSLPSVLLSVFSLTHLGTLWVDEIAGIALGAIALVQLRRARQAPVASDRPGPREGDLLALGGIVVGMTSLALAILIYFVVPRLR